MILRKAFMFTLTVIFAVVLYLAISTISIASPLATSLTGRYPQQDVQRFNRAVHVIQRYYIKDVNDNKLFNYAIRGMITNLDPHSSFLDSEAMKELKAQVSGEFVGIGIELTSQHGALKVISPLEGTPAFRAGVKANDLIVKINNQLVQNMSLREAVKRIKGQRGTKVKLTIIRKGASSPLNLMITRDVIKIKTVKSKMLAPGYGYVRITFFQGPVSKMLADAINTLRATSDKPLKGFILDLRNNPGGLLDESAKVADTFLNARRYHKYNDLIVYTKGRIPGSNLKFKMQPGDILQGTPMVVLINGGSASASEIVAGALQAYKRAIIMGTKSFGKGSVQTVIPIGKNDAIKLTTALYYTPNGKVIQARGITPDVTIPELEINSKKITGLIDINESQLRNHLDNKTKKDDNAKHKTREKLIKMAKDDYQLYEAMMMLKGLHAIQSGNQKP